MAKKKAVRKKVGRPLSERGARTQVIAIKAYPEWKDWLEEFRNARGDMNFVDVIDAGLKLLAKVEKFREPPPR
jgi:hypothetical protein